VIALKKTCFLQILCNVLKKYLVKFPVPRIFENVSPKHHSSNNEIGHIFKAAQSIFVNRSRKA